MAAINWSIAQLFENVHGRKSPEYDFKGPLGQQQTNEGGAPYTAKDAFGREYYMPVTLGGVAMPYPVMSIRGRKTIVETPLVERKGTVKELINIDDYQITIRGLIIARNRGYFPESEVAQLRELFERNEALPIVSVLTDLFIKTSSSEGAKVVVKDFDFPPAPGMKHVRGYELQLVSDEEFNLVDIS